MRTASRKRGINETLSFIDRPVVTQHVRQLGQHFALDRLLAALMETAMDGFVIRLALREELPLRAGVQNPIIDLYSCLSGVPSPCG